MANKINLGRVTAYADAVAQGYTGTREEFAKDLANWTSTAEEMSEAAQTASAQAQAATDAAENATLSEEKAKGYAESAETAKTASETAQAASEAAKESAESAKSAAGLSESNAKLYAQAAKNSQTAAETAQTAAKASADSTAEVYTEFKAKAESGDFDGYSPTVEVTENEGSHTVAITDKDGTKSFNVKDGKTGASSWDDLAGKPFSSVGDGLSVSDGVLSASDGSSGGGDVLIVKGTYDWSTKELTLDAGTTTEEILAVINSVFAAVKAGKACFFVMNGKLFFPLMSKDDYNMGDDDYPDYIKAARFLGYYNEFGQVTLEHHDGWNEDWYEYAKATYEKISFASSTSDTVDSEEVAS